MNQCIDAASEREREREREGTSCKQLKGLNENMILFLILN